MRKIYRCMAVSLLILCVFLLGSCSKQKEDKDSNTVRVYCYGDYFDPTIIKDFEKETGIKVILDTFDTNEEMFPVISKGTVTYDAICTSDYMVEKLMAEDLIQPLDKEKIPNFKNIDSRFLDLAKSFDQDNKYAMPHTFGTLGVLYNTNYIKKGEINSWLDLWKKEYKDQILMPDSIRDLMAIGLKAENKSINSTNPKEVAKAAHLLEKQKALVYKYVNDAARDLAIGEIVPIATVWSGEVIYAKEENPSLEYIIPKEGSEQFMDMWVIPKNCHNKENAEKWINFLADKKIAIKNYEYLTYSIPNVAVIDYVKKEEPENLDILFPSEETLKNCEFLKPLDKKNLELYSKYWKEFKLY